MVENTPGSGASLLAWALRQAYGRMVGLVADLDDGALAWRPMPQSHSIGFALWHIARCDDNYLRAHIQGRPEVWQEESWFQSWGLDQDSTGMLLSDEEAADLQLPSKEHMLAYCKRVWDELTWFVEGMGLEGLSRRVDQVERTRGMSTGQVIITHIYGHDNRHLGEMEYLKGLLGLRGSVTL